MIIDNLLNFSDAQALTATADATNVADLGPVTDNTTRDIGTGEPIYFVVTVGTELDSAADGATLAVGLKSDSTTNLDTSETVHISVTGIAEASCVAGAVLVAQVLPPGNYERYLGVEYTVTGENFTSGTINAFLTKDAQLFKTYAARKTISAITG